MKYCSLCGGGAPDEARFCPTCGTRLPEAQAQPGGTASANPYPGPSPYGGPPPTWQPGPNSGSGRSAAKPRPQSMLIAIVGLTLSTFLNPVLVYPVILFGLHLANRELAEGLTDSMTARNVCVGVLIVTIIWHVVSIFMILAGYNIYG